MTADELRRARRVEATKRRVIASLRELQAAEGVSNAELARRMGVTRQAVCQFTGPSVKSLALSTVIAIGHALGREVEVVFKP